MDISHSTVDVTLADYYAADYVDRLDELKTNIDERQVLSQSAAAALGRKTDSLIIDVLDGGSNSANIAHGSAGLTLAKALTTYETFGGADVPDDGGRYFVVSPAGWADLLQVDQFSRAEYIGEAGLPYGMTATPVSIESSDLMELSSIVTNKINGIVRLVYDYTGKPPGTIEWQ